MSLRHPFKEFRTCSESDPKIIINLNNIDKIKTLTTWSRDENDAPGQTSIKKVNLVVYMMKDDYRSAITLHESYDIDTFCAMLNNQDF